ncbi:MAG: 3-isopropylmalate dehydratase large subunit [Bacteroidales bacterium]|nr:MAG: 3-isopropylmalate dehydratase large subunit [Bacteroidales bacterium]
MKGKTLFDKIWDSHVVHSIPEGPDVLYIDRHYIHEVTSPQAFDGLGRRKVKVFRPRQTTATADHNVPTINQHLEVKDLLSRTQLDKLKENCDNHDIELYDLNHEFNGIVHVIGPELGYTQPGMTIVCGDSHTSTHGAFGAIAFGIGTSEVEMVLATQTILQYKPLRMRINVEGTIQKGVTSKDIILYIIQTLGVDGSTGYFVEYAGSVIRSMSMEGRMTVCNMSIEMGARGGLIAPDGITEKYIKNRQFSKGKIDYIDYKTDDNATFDKEVSIDISTLEPIVTYGTNPAMSIPISKGIPKLENLNENDRESLSKSLRYMGFRSGQRIEGEKVSYIFIGSCTNGRIEDLRDAAKILKGRKVADNVTVWIVPGSNQVALQAKQEGLDKIFSDAGAAMRQPGCSACLAMNDDKVPAGEICIATSNRNFEGRQGVGAKTILSSPLTAAASAVTGIITDPRVFL